MLLGLRKRKWKKSKRENPLIYQTECERNKKAMQNRWKSDIYREIEMVHKRTKCHNCSYKYKETIKNTLQKQKAREHLCNVLNEKQKVEFRKYGKET